jgi:archaellum component FlaC
MKKILFSLIIIIALIGNINIAEAQYAHPATAIKSTNGNVQTDLNTLQSSLGGNTQEIALITAEIEIIQANLDTIEDSLQSLSTNDQTQETEIATLTSEVLALQTNVGTLEDLVNSNYAWTTQEIATMTEEIDLIQANISTIEIRLDEHYANLETHEIKIDSNETAILLNESRYSNTASSGKISGGIFTYDGGSGIAYTTMEIAIKDRDSQEAELKYFTIPAGNKDTSTLASNEVGILYMDYNNGIPQILIATDRTTIRTTDQFDLVRFYKNESTIYIGTYGFQAFNFARREHERTSARGVAERMSGAIIAEKATRYVTITPSTWYGGTSYVTKEASDSQTDGFEHYYSYNSTTQTWTDNIATNPNQINNTQYNRTSDGTLQTLTANRYGVHWVYIGGSSKLSIVFGVGDYKASEYGNAQPPSTLPSYLSKFAALVGRIVIVNGASTFTSVDSVFNIHFNPASVINHDDLANRTLADSHPASAISYIDNQLLGVTDLQNAIDTVAVWLGSIDVINDSQDVAIETNRSAIININIELDSIAVAINNLDLRSASVETLFIGGISGEVMTRTDTGFTWAAPTSGVTDHLLLSNIGTKTHDQLELDIAALQSNPAGISKVWVDGVALPTGEVEFVAGSNVTLNVTGSTVEIVATSSGTGATVEAILSQNYVARSQGTAEVGYFSIYDFDITSSIIVTGTIVPTVNGLVQYETTHFTIGTWDDSGTNKLRITFTSDVSSTALVRVSCFTTLPLLAVISADNVSTTNGWLQSDLDSFEAGINDRYTKAETNATIEAALLNAGGKAIEDTGVFISSNVFEFSTDYSTAEVMIFRNGIYQPRRLFTTEDVVGKTRVTFISSINDSDEIVLISTTGE